MALFALQHVASGDYAHWRADSNVRYEGDDYNYAETHYELSDCGDNVWIITDRDSVESMLADLAKGRYRSHGSYSYPFVSDRFKRECQEGLWRVVKLQPV